MCAETRFAEGFMALTCFLVSFLRTSLAIVIASFGAAAWANSIVARSMQPGNAVPTMLTSWKGIATSAWSAHEPIA